MGDLDGLMHLLASTSLDNGIEGFGSQVWREHVCKFNILVGDLCKSFLGYQAGYLRSTGRVNIERGEVGQCNGIE